jgi:hypothetical protein
MERLAEMSCSANGYKAPMLTIQDVRAIREVIVPKRRITKRDIREFSTITGWRSRRARSEGV